MNESDERDIVPRNRVLQRQRLIEVARLFLRLGLTAFGGPAAHISLMREEVVRRRNWISDERFVDLLGVTALIPGPSSTEMAIYLGYMRAGWPGLLLGGVCFIAPAMLIVLALGWAYVTYDALPQVGWLLYGIKPVVVAIITQALYGLSRTVIRTTWSLVFALVVLLLYLLGINTLLLLVGSGLMFGLIRGVRRWRSGEGLGAMTLLPLDASLHRWRLPELTPALLSVGAAAAVAPASLRTLFVTFLKIGAVLYGSGYVLLAFLRSDVVLALDWLTDRQLLDAVSIGQFTPGPVFTTATFIGYLVLGWQGALVATFGIFIPSFVFVAAVHPVAVRLRRSPWTSPFLDGANVAALALMAGVLIQLGQHALSDVLTSVEALAAFLILMRFKINSAWLILAGAALGLFVFWLR